MADYYQLVVEKRDSFGRGANRALRRNGKIPANYYYKDTGNINLILDSKNLYHALHSGQHIFEVDLEGETQYVMIKEIQYHPVNESVIHVDIMRVRRDVKMTISVPIHLEGEAVGVTEGGVLSQILTSLDIECLPTDVPEFIPIDVTDLEMNSSVSVADINVSGDVAIITDEEQVVASIAPPKEEEEPEVEVDEEEGEEGEEEGEATHDGEEKEASADEASEKGGDKNEESAE